MKIRKQDPKAPKILRFEELVAGETYMVDDVLYLAGKLVIGVSSKTDTYPLKVINLKTGNVYSIGHCAHMKFIRVEAEVVL